MLVPVVWIIVGLTTAGLLVLGALAVLAYREVVALARALQRSAARVAKSGEDVERAAEAVARRGGATLLTTAAPSIQAPNGSA
jgi:hypothetical protein